MVESADTASFLRYDASTFKFESIASMSPVLSRIELSTGISREFFGLAVCY